MRQRERRCSERLELQDKEMESPYVCEGCEPLIIEIGDRKDGVLTITTDSEVSNETI